MQIRTPTKNSQEYPFSGIPYDSLFEEAPLKRVYERLGIIIAEVLKRVGKNVISVRRIHNTDPQSMDHLCGPPLIFEDEFTRGLKKF